MCLHSARNSNVSMERKATGGSQGYSCELTLLSIYTHICIHYIHRYRKNRPKKKNVPRKLHITKFKQPQDLQSHYEYTLIGKARNPALI